MCCFNLQFQEREAKQRKEAVSMLHKENEGGDAGNATAAAAEPKLIKSVSMSTEEKKSPEKKKTKSNKPAWALTESVAQVCACFNGLCAEWLILIYICYLLYRRHRRTKNLKKGR